MSLLWIMIPVTFVLWMQTRSFYKMKQERRRQLLKQDIERSMSGTTVEESESKEAELLTHDETKIINDNSYVVIDPALQTPNPSQDIDSPQPKLQRRPSKLTMFSYDMRDLEQSRKDSSTSSMQDFFARCNPLDETKPIKCEEFNQCNTRNASFEDDLKIIRSVGKNLLRESTQGYLLLMNRKKQRQWARHPRTSQHISECSNSFDNDEQIGNAMVTRSFGHSHDRERCDNESCLI